MQWPTGWGGGGERHNHRCPLRNKGSTLHTGLPSPGDLHREDEPFNIRPGKPVGLISGRATAAAAAKSLQSWTTVQPHRRQPTRLPCPWDPPGKNTGVGCHFLLQCMKVKSESEVAQSCLTLSDPMDCSLPGSSIHGIFQARVLQWGDIAFSEGEPQGYGKPRICS